MQNEKILHIHQWLMSVRVFVGVRIWFNNSYQIKHLRVCCVLGCMRACTCVCACVCACVRACVCVHCWNIRWQWAKLVRVLLLLLLLIGGGGGGSGALLTYTWEHARHKLLQARVIDRGRRSRFRRWCTRRHYGIGCSGLCRSRRRTSTFRGGCGRCWTCVCMCVRLRDCVTCGLMQRCIQLLIVFGCLLLQVNERIIIGPGC